MTRILVCGSADYKFVHRALNEVNFVYGPVTCVIHSNHKEGLAWQQAVSAAQVVKHLPIAENPKIDGKVVNGVSARGSEHRDRLFAHGRPDYVIVFQTADKKDDRDGKVRYIVHRANSSGIPVVTYIAPPKPVERKDREIKADYEESITPCLVQGPAAEEQE